jgi:hypothetical protein
MFSNLVFSMMQDAFEISVLVLYGGLGSDNWGF